MKEKSFSDELDLLTGRIVLIVILMPSGIATFFLGAKLLYEVSLKGVVEGGLLPNMLLWIPGILLVFTGIFSVLSAAGEIDIVLSKIRLFRIEKSIAAKQREIQELLSKTPKKTNR